MKRHSYRYLILGGGLVAGYAAQRFAAGQVRPGELAIVSAESSLPYERPPLSKGFLAGKESAADILINDAGFYDEHGIDVYLNSRVTRIDPARRRLYAGADEFEFERLLIATGAHPRRLELPGGRQAGIYYLRQLEDARHIRRVAADARRAIVIGGSFIGMEVAAVLRQAGLETTMVFPGDRVWASFFTPEMSAFFEATYRDRGVRLVKQATVTAFPGDGRRARGVTLASGRELEADMIVAGVGVTPNIGLFAGTDLALNDGVEVNERLQTSVPGIFAAGDVARFRDTLFGRKRRIEHWDNAVTQAKYVAATMMGATSEPFAHVPYFFSDVFDLSYEFWGDATEDDDAIHRGDLDTGSFSVWWLRHDRLRAAFVMGGPAAARELAPEWIRQQVRLRADALADEYTPLANAVAEEVMAA